jgi:hypothetical protein
MQHSTRLIGLVGTAIAIAACSAGKSESVSGRSTRLGRDTLATTDWRRPWVGRWTVELFVDSTHYGGTQEPHLAASGARAVGTLTITNVLDGHHELASEFNVSIEKALGRPVSCFDPLPRTIGLDSLPADSVSVAFTPHAFDCGLVAMLVRHGDSAHGRWWETSFGGPIVWGRLHLRRAP